MNLYVWDFHGTLETGNEKSVLHFSNLALESFDSKARFTQGEIDMLYGQNWENYFEYLEPHQEASYYIDLVLKAKEHVNNDYATMRRNMDPTPHAFEVLDYIAENHHQILLSNASSTALDYFVEAVGMQKYFPEGKRFPCNNNKPGESKIDVLQSYLKKNNSWDQVFVIGDSEADVALGNACNAITFLYAHPGKEFRGEVPITYKIRDLRRVIEN